VGLAATGLTEEQQGAVLGDEPQRGQVGDEFAVDGGLELEVEVLDGATEGEPGVTQPGGQAAVGGRRCLFGDHLGQELDMGPAVPAGLFRQRGEAFRGPTQLQVAEVVLQLLVEAGGGHRVASAEASRS
jgi:hypothetical protein